MAENSTMARLVKVHRVSGIFTNFFKDIGAFCQFLFRYTKKHVQSAFAGFETQKNTLVKLFMMKRGRYSRPFLHIATIGLLGIGIMLTPVLADTYPIFSSRAEQLQRIPSPNSTDQSIEADQNVFNTNISDKPRSDIVTYTVQRGDTLSTIAQKFSQPNNTISVDSIKWLNNMTDDSVTVGDDIKIPPTSGVIYKVQSGDTIYSIAKKFNTNPQKIADWPFNDFADAETFSLVVGQQLVVPDGVAPAQQPSYQPAPIQYAQAPATNGASGDGFHWPIQGIITQYFTIYHTGLDIAGPIGTPIYASKAGRIEEASCGWNWGYGCHVLMDNGGGYETMYAHMVTQPVVSVGQAVGTGQLIGYRGDTGNSTGPHTHFEIRFDHHVVNPLSYLQ